MLGRGARAETCRETSLSPLSNKGSLLIPESSFLAPLTQNFLSSKAIHKDLLKGKKCEGSIPPAAMLLEPNNLNRP